ncbi:MAG: acyl carrier protein [Gemmatimonadetes bacterium]|jgi:methoxymalonate biosynthesis acyl carrier protein|nr:acyl carrier protein [Gemmatimonadota bacterium]
MTAETIKEKIIDHLAQSVADADIPDDQDIFASGLVNSLFAMQLVLFIEKEFQFKVEDEDLDINNFNTIAAMVGFIGRKTS